MLLKYVGIFMIKVFLEHSKVMFELQEKSNDC